MFAILAVPLLGALQWVNGFVGNYGWAIVILTILINLVMWPLRHKSVVSMRRMQELQPQLKAIQDRYSHLKMTDPARQKMNEEVMALYKAKGVNPASGCVPMLLTLPVLFAFYSLLSQAIEIRGAPFAAWITDLSQHDPWYITPLLMGATMVWQQRLQPGHRRPGAAEGADVHAGDVHGDVPLGAERAGDLLVHQQPVGDRTAVLHQLADWAGQDSGANGRQAMNTAPIVEFVQSVVDAMDLDLTASAEEEADGIRINLDGDDGSVFTRRQGEALQALQQIVGSAFRGDRTDERRLVVDCNGYRRDKDTELHQMAAFLAEKAKSTGLAQEMGPLNPYERRIVHMAVAAVESVTSESIGDAFEKTVIISVK